MVLEKNIKKFEKEIDDLISDDDITIVAIGLHLQKQFNKLIKNGKF